jgi:hypothetical protein
MVYFFPKNPQKRIQEVGDEVVFAPAVRRTSWMHLGTRPLAFLEEYFILYL